MIEERSPVYNPFDNMTDRKEALIDYEAIRLSTEIDLNKSIEHPPVAIGMGEYTYQGNHYPIPFGSYGDISCIVGASKSKKTFFKSAIIAGYIGGTSNNYFSNIQGLKGAGKWIIDIDTEQSRYHSQRTFRRVQYMTGIDNPHYKCFALREYTPPERLKFIDWLINDSPYSDNIGLISIDGYADLVTDFNNIDQASEVSNKLMKWSSDKNCHITGILHRNFGTMKPVGHLGSFILKKAETVVFVDSDKDSGHTKVTCEYSRGLSFEDIYFSINDDHLPYKIDDPVTDKPQF